MKYVIVALVFAFSATGADAHYPARVHHARYKHHPPAYPEDYAAPELLRPRRRHRRRVSLGCMSVGVVRAPLLVIERRASWPVTSPGSIDTHRLFARSAGA